MTEFGELVLGAAPEVRVLGLFGLNTAALIGSGPAPTPQLQSHRRKISGRVSFFIKKTLNPTNRKNPG